MHTTYSNACEPTAQASTVTADGWARCAQPKTGIAAMYQKSRFLLLALVQSYVLEIAHRMHSLHVCLSLTGTMFVPEDLNCMR